MALNYPARMRLVIFFAATLFVSGPAIACDCITLHPTAPRFAADLERIAEYYPVAAEGVIEADGQYAWKFQPTREYRGAGKASYSIELISDCSLGPDELTALVGKPVFLLLSGEGERYEASRCVNLLGADIENAIRKRIVDCKAH